MIFNWLTFNLKSLLLSFLLIGLASAKAYPGEDPVGYNLPLMIIETHGKLIERSPRRVVDMGLIYNGEGKLNYADDEFNEYSGKLGINRRGQSSYGFPKRQYRIELQNEDGSNNNVSILGLPRENDFIMYGPHSEKTFMKNVISYELFARTGRYAPRTRYVEAIIDGDYRGIYVLTEKIKRDRYRVDISRLRPEPEYNEWPAITGGYILKRDKTYTSDPEEWWQSPVQQPYHNQMWYEFHNPKQRNLTPEQEAYMKDWMKGFDEMMSGDNFKDPVHGFRSYVDVGSFIDFMLISEINKGIDNYNFSTYFYKENDEEGGRLVAGPPWDYNFGFGNVNYGQDWNASETFGWCYTQGGRTYWFRRLMEDEAYRNKVYRRWTELRDGPFSDHQVLNMIDSCVYVLGDAVERNFEKYPILGVWVNPALHPVPDTYEGEVENLVDWLIERLAWIDDQWYGRYRDMSVETDDSMIHYWHFNEEEGEVVEEVMSDFSRSGQGKIVYAGPGDGYMDSRTFRRGDPVSNMNLRGGEQSNHGAVLRVRNPSEGRSMVVKTPVAGFKNIEITFATTRTTNGPTHQTHSYSVDGGESWMILNEMVEVPLLPEWAPHTYRLPPLSLSGVNNNPNLQFKVEFTGENNTGDNGNNRFDNFSVRGTPVDPTSSRPLVSEPAAVISPNPANDYLTFELESGTDLQGVLQVYHINGRLVKEMVVSDQHTRLPVYDLTPGVYFINYTTHNGRFTERFIKY